MIPAIPVKILRKMNYFSDQRGILGRYINEEGAWENHLAKTKEYIINCLGNKKPQSVAVLGSGWLLDVPLEYMAKNIKRVMLLDISHPPQIKHKIKKYDNMELIIRDISGGGILSVYNHVKEYKKNRTKGDLNEIELQGLKFVQQPDYIISLNILNQLDMLLAEYLKKYGIYEDNELNYLRKRIQKLHIDSLIPGKSCLITDYEEEIYNQDGTFDFKRDLILTDLPRPKNKKKWKWYFDSSGSYYPGKKVVFNVMAMEL